jgi:hypothetical protein
MFHLTVVDEHTRVERDGHGGCEGRPAAPRGGYRGLGLSLE